LESLWNARNHDADHEKNAAVKIQVEPDQAGQEENASHNHSYDEIVLRYVADFPLKGLDSLRIV
jgi:hypothetical protein